SCLLFFPATRLLCQEEEILDVEQRGSGQLRSSPPCDVLGRARSRRGEIPARRRGRGDRNWQARPARSWDWLDPPDTRIARKANPNPSPSLSSQLQRNPSICPHVSGYFIRRRLKGVSSFPSL